MANFFTLTKKQEDGRSVAPEAYSGIAGHENMNNLSEKMNNDENRDNRREARVIQILGLYGQGYSQIEIADKLQISQPTVSKELKRKIKHVYENMDEHVQDIWNTDVRAVEGRRKVQRELWSIENDPSVDIKVRLKALSLLDRSYSETNHTIKGRQALREWGHAALKTEKNRDREYEELLENDRKRTLQIEKVKLRNPDTINLNSL